MKIWDGKTYTINAGESVEVPADSNPTATFAVYDGNVILHGKSRADLYDDSTVVLRGNSTALRK